MSIQDEEQRYYSLWALDSIGEEGARAEIEREEAETMEQLSSAMEEGA